MLLLQATKSRACTALDKLIVAIKEMSPKTDRELDVLVSFDEVHALSIDADPSTSEGTTAAKGAATSDAASTSKGVTMTEGMAMSASEKSPTSPKLEGMTASASKGSSAAGEMSASSSGGSIPNNSQRRKLRLDYLFRAMNTFGSQSIFFVILSTQSSIEHLAPSEAMARSARYFASDLHAPLTETPFDCFGVTKSKLKVSTFPVEKLSDTVVMALFGRPMCVQHLVPAPVMTAHFFFVSIYQVEVFAQEVR
jgi:hypothetical protein